MAEGMTGREELLRLAERKAVARCIEIIREKSEDFLSPDYATPQPIGSFSERFACDLCADAIGAVFGMGTKEQCELLGKPTPAQQYRAAMMEEG